MHDIAYIAVGTSKQSWQLPGGYQIAGVVIHNPSGSWLHIPQDNSFVPPYTLGWAHSFSPKQARIDILFADGPAGQKSTTDGDNPQAQIYDLTVAESAGVSSSGGQAFIEQSVEPLFVLLQAQTCPESVGKTIIPVVGIPNTRVRIYEISFCYAIDTGTNEQMDGSVKAFPNGTGTSADQFAVGVITPEHPIERLTFDPPHNLPIGESLQIDFFASWVDVIIDCSVRYRYV